MKGLTVSSAHPMYHRAYTTDKDASKSYPDLNDFEAMAEDYLRDNLGIKLEVRSFFILSHYII